LSRLREKTSGALALVSGRSLNDIDLIFAPEQFPAVGGHGAEMRISIDNEAVARLAPPMDKELKRRLAAIARLSPGILIEDKGYSLALHYRLAPHAEKAIYEAVSLIRSELPQAPVEVLPGKCVCEIKQSGFDKATGVRELMAHEPFRGRRPIFIGDDVTDESVFAIMPDLGGLAFSVGRRARGVTSHFDEPRDVRAWLARLTDGEAGAGR
jgi:trehalose 6-phosphate phosphatase